MDKFYLEKAKNILLARKQTAEALNYSAIFELSKLQEYETLHRDKISLIKSMSEIGANRQNISLQLYLCELAIEKLANDNMILLNNFSCKNCNDSGLDKHGNKCQCLICLYNDVVKQLTVGSDIKEFTFADSKLPQCKQKDGVIALYNKLENYCNEFPNNNKKMLYISGGVGVGKSYIISAMANALIAKGVAVNYLSSFNLNNILVKHHTNQLHDNGAALQSILNCQALFIDDLGCEPIYKNVTSEYLYSILEDRENKHTFITSNLDASSSNIKEKYGERIFSRLANKSKCVLIKVDGEDLRLK